MKTAVVILNWNGIDFLKQFLSTLIERTPEADVVVIDNNSTDDSLNYLGTNFPAVRTILLEKNHGFAKGYNEGLKKIQGEYEFYVLINSDIEVSTNWLNPLLQKLNSDPKIAGVQPKVLSYSNKHIFEHAGACGGFIDKNYYPFCRGRIFHKVEEDVGQYDSEKEIFWATGACLALKADVFHLLEGFDEDFFAHQEEIDWCWRAKKRGYSFFVAPSSVVYHVGGGTLNYESPRKTYLNFRNSLFMIHKNYEGWLFGMLFHRLILDGIAGIKFLAGFQFRHVLSIIRAHFSYYQQLSSLRKKRKKIKEESTDFNSVGIYNSPIVWDFYFKGNKKFNQLNKRFFNS